MTDPEASFDAHAAVSNVTLPVAMHLPAFQGQPGAESAEEPAAGGAAPESAPAGGFDGGAASISSAETGAEPESAVFDIGAASFGQGLVFAEAIIGNDDRVQQTQTDQYVWRAIASLRITARDGSQWLGTGWFISPRTLITAGHVVYIKGSGDPNRDGWVSNIDVVPGRNAAVKPFGTVKATTFWSVRGWTERGDQNQDYAAIILDTPLGISTGWFGYGVFDDNRLVGVQAHVAGYPGDKALGTLWHHSLPIASVSVPKVFYAIDTAGGQSGAAVYVLENNLPIAVAVHAYGGSVSNSGTRIIPPVFQNLRQWSL
ncbi:MAG TPA: trypsin-like serine protease [Thermoanaerobaculia bacterium]|nr:trypsin-like serine protease [Thermoanaerobaculia bacterium]